mgnify:CR=1 FL=1
MISVMQKSDEDCDVEWAELNVDPRRVDVNFDDIVD